MRKMFSIVLMCLLILSIGMTASATDVSSELELKTGHVAAGAFHSVWIQPDGNATSTNSAATSVDLSSWKDITKVAAHHQTLGLRSDGTVTLVDGTGRHHLYNGHFTARDVAKWSDIVDIDASECNIAGVTVDGTVVVLGANKYRQCDVANWEDVVDVALSTRNTYGLKSNGTVLVAGDSGNGQRAVSGWRDIEALSAGPNHVVGLKKDGTVVSTANAEEVDFWTDIVAVAAGGNHTIGLREDGTVVAVGNNDKGQCNVGGWTDIVAIDAGTYHTVAMRADGTLVAVGSNAHLQCDVS